MARYKRKSPKKLPVKLREIRLRLGMTQEELAKRLGTDSGAVSRFEHGKRDPSLLEMLVYSNLAGLTINELVDDKVKLK
jgi:transcriptional regulator with XRE-family HTH domain